MNWKISSNCPWNFKKMHRVLIPFLFCFLPLVLFGENKEIQRITPPEAWEQIAPYLMPEDHPLKKKLDAFFSKSRILQDRDSLIKAGFTGAKSRRQYKLVVSQNSKIPGYVFKMYPDDITSAALGKPEYVRWIKRAKGAEMLREEIAKQGWQAYFKAPIKWIYALPATPKAKPGHFQKNFILVEEDMGLLPTGDKRERWQDGTITPQHLHMLFHLVTKFGLNDSCAPCNIPICKDGRIAFVDTQSNLRWPPRYFRLFPVLNDELGKVWQSLIEENAKEQSPKL